MISRPPTEPGEGEQQAVLEVQIVSIDYYMAPLTPADCALRTPYNVFEKPLKQVPVVRIFGVTRSEQKICLHVHQVWPYLYVPYSGMQSIEAVRQFGYQLGLSLNHALNVSLKSTELLFVAAVIPVKGVPFYGFCAGYRSFLKVFLANPDMLARASSLLASGAVMGRRHEVFESHLSYTMQFLVDYNLYGVDWVCLDNFLFRSPLPEYAADPRLPLLISDSTVASKHRWVPQGVPSYLVNPTPPDRVSRCELEVDAVAADVANRRQVKERQIHHVFQEDQLEARFGRLLHSLDSIWIDENQRRAQLGLDPLRPKDSQVQLDMSQIPDCRPATQARPREPQWSNHWRMHSLLQSALADDKRRYLSQLGANQSDMVTDMLGLCSSMVCNGDSMESLGADTFSTDAAWLSDWPTCREVDIGYVPLISSDGHGNGRFYSQLLSRLSSVQHAALVAEPNRHVGVSLPESVSNAQQESPLDPVAWPVIVDVGLIDCIEAGTRDSGAYIADTGNESADSSGLPRACYSPSAASASDADDFDDLHGSWIEDELQRTEEERRQSDRVPVSEILHSSRSPCGAASIPQLDGTNDEPQKSARRVAAPLRLAYSASTAAERLVADGRRRRRRGASALVLQSTSDHLAKGVGGRSTRSATRDAQRGVSAAGHSTTRKAHLHSELRTLRRHNEVYVDIQHEEGQYLANFIKSQCSAACVADSADRACSIGGSSQDANPSWSDIQQTSRYIAYAFRPEPPSISKLASTLSVYNLVESVAPVPAFLDDQDVPKRAKTYSGLRICSSSRGAHNTSLFGPTYMHGRGCDSPGDGRSRNSHSDMRQEAWEKSAITDLNRSIAKASGLCQQQWHEGWWQFSLPPPRVYSYLSKVHNVGAEAIAATPAQRRQRDQSDLKWSSVLGALSAYPGAASQNTAVVVSDISPRSPELPGATPIPSNNRLPTGRGTKVPMSEMSLEILTSCRETALADPSLDEILCISACFVDYGLQSSKMRAKHRDIVWTCGLSAEPTVRVGFSSRVERRHLADELNMIMALVDWTRENDPD
ncbi:DNA polymerase zeta, partial [Coemansia sp. RSA 2681]